MTRNVGITGLDDNEEELNDFVVAQFSPELLRSRGNITAVERPLREDDREEAPLTVPEFLQDAEDELRPLPTDIDEVDSEDALAEDSRPAPVDAPMSEPQPRRGFDPSLIRSSAPINISTDPNVLQRQRNNLVPFPTEAELENARLMVSSDASNRIAREAADGIRYTRRDFVERDDLYEVAQNYLVRRHGVHHEEMDREKNVDTFLSHMRKYSGGNSLTNFNEFRWVNSQLRNDNTSSLVAANTAYDMFDNMAGIFSRDYTMGERMRGVGTYLRAAIIDPTTPISIFGAGLIMRGAGAGTARAIQVAAREAADTAVANAVRKGATTQVQQRVRRETEQRAIARFATSGGISQSAAQRQAALASGAMRDKVALWTTSGVVDASLNVGIDAMYQAGMMRTGRQEEFNKLQSGVSAFMGLAIPAAGVGYEALRYGMSRPIIQDTAGGIVTQQDVYRAIVSKDLAVVNPETAARATASEIEPVAEQFTLKLNRGLDAIIDGEQVGDWSLATARGKATPDRGDFLDEVSFWEAVLLGEDGLATSLREVGFGSSFPMGRRYEGDNITNHIADVLRQLPEQYKQQVFVRLQKAGEEAIPQYRDMTMDQLADRLAYIQKAAGTVLGTMGRTAREIGTASKIVDELDNSLGPARSPRAPKPDANTPPTKLDKVTKRISYAQDYMIRSLVTHPSTTALNIKGWAAYEGVFGNASDLTRAMIYGGRAVYETVKPGSDPQMSIQMAKAAFRQPFTRMQYLLDPDMSLEAVRAYLSQRGELSRSLGETLYGGVTRRRTAEEAVEEFGFDPNQNVMTATAERTQEFFQRMYFATGQDMYTKSISFLTNMDRFVREEYGMSFKQVLDSSDPAQYLNSSRWRQVESKALDNTLKAVFSKSYHTNVTGRTDLVGKAATFFEEAKQVPVLGAFIPFGRFFNNTVNFLVESTPAAPLLKLGGKAYKDDDWADVVSKSAFSGALVIGMAYYQERELIDRGLSWKHTIADDGAISSREYEYPYSLWKGTARVIAHLMRDEPVPEELLRSVSDMAVTGQITRELSNTSTSVTNFIEAMFTAEGRLDQVVMDGFIGAAKQVANVSSGVMRPLDPFNQAVALARGEDYYVGDRNQGYVAINNALRYVDQPADMLVEMLTGERLLQPARSITQPFDLPATPERVFSERIEAPLTNTNWMFNTVGRDDWRVAMRAREAPEAAARFNELFFFELEDRAETLRNDRSFRDMSMGRKNLAVTGAIQEARKSVKELLEVSLDYDDRRYDLILNLVGSNNSYGRRRVDAMLINNFGNASISDLAIEDLERLKFMLDNQERYIP